MATSLAVENRPPAGIGCRLRSLSGYLSWLIVVSSRPFLSLVGRYDFASRLSCSSLGQKVVSVMPSGPEQAVVHEILVRHAADDLDNPARGVDARVGI